MSTIIITASRDWWDKPLLFSVLDQAHQELPVTLVVQGGCRGGDELAEMWAHSRGIANLTVHADWDRQGRAAGPMRNRKMLQMHPGSRVYAFPIGLSRGTRGCMLMATEKGHRVITTEGVSARRD